MRQLLLSCFLDILDIKHESWCIGNRYISRYEGIAPRFKVKKIVKIECGSSVFYFR